VSMLESAMTWTPGQSVTALPVSQDSIVSSVSGSSSSSTSSSSGSSYSSSSEKAGVCYDMDPGSVCDCTAGITGQHCELGKYTHSPSSSSSSGGGGGSSSNVVVRFNAYFVCSERQETGD